METIGVKYKNSLDLLSGVIFVKDGKIVYEELIETEGFSNRVQFQIFPHREMSQKPNYRIFTPDEAVFECKGVQYDNISRNYRLYPIN